MDLGGSRANTGSSVSKEFSDQDQKKAIAASLADSELKIREEVQFDDKSVNFEIR